ncbi:hypothetical protein B0H67DRAFT_550288 [Lasiosphaeris hirsuta]|uniref:Methyltransferase domain-containing protein n=1 Tax=Lasiosphaeris hirsuta TaxID=260670 RepID=A0AA40AYZ1_9PEZI|nr:hypothetical protein B0H67DRAFT_550288 [Lasiosphaeris hirsuta]
MAATATHYDLGIARVGVPSRDLPWCMRKDANIPWPARRLLEKYSHIPSEDVEKTVFGPGASQRGRAWEVYPYPCIGHWDFLDFQLAARNDLYHNLLSRIKGGAKHLDIGCCLGHDIRKLIFDGAPSENLVGVEISQGYTDLGFDLFRDKETTKTRFFQGDVLESAGLWPQLEGKFDVVNIGMFLHLFTWEENIKVFERALKSLKTGELGTTIIGNAVGNINDGVMVHYNNEAIPTHNVESFQRLISQFEERTGTKWEVSAELDTGLGIYDGKRPYVDPKIRRLIFQITWIAQGILPIVGEDKAGGSNMVLKRSRVSILFAYI